MSFVVKAFFEDGETSVVAENDNGDYLYQYNYGSLLEIDGLSLPPVVRIDFSYDRRGGTSKPYVGTTSDGKTSIQIPNEYLVNNDTDKNYKVYAFVYVADEISGTTVKRISIPVKSRPKSEEYVAPPDNPNILDEAIALVRRYAEEANASEESAEAWAHGNNFSFPERSYDNAKYYAYLAKNAVSGAIENITKNTDAALTEISNKKDSSLTEIEKKRDEAIQNIKESRVISTEYLNGRFFVKTKEVL